MSDFLDRLVIRTIGHESMLVPRLPSLFEPLQVASLMPRPDDGGARETRHESTMVAPGVAPATPEHTPSRSLHGSLEPARHANIRRDAATEAPQSSAEPSPAISRPIPTTSWVAAVDHAAPSVATSRPQPFVAPAPVKRREQRVMPPSLDAEKLPRTAVGVLLPAPSSGIRTSRVEEGSASLRSAPGIRSARPPTDSARSLPSEPVVHVSIGRIEVRAAPAVATAARVREPARTSSLDEYLRQRGGKVPS